MDPKHARDLPLIADSPRSKKESTTNRAACAGVDKGPFPNSGNLLTKFTARRPVVLVLNPKKPHDMNKLFKD